MKRIAIISAVAVSVAAGAMLSGIAETVAGGETRTLSLYHIHTKENITITYMKNGRYIPSAMTKINYIMRDWRKDKAVRIDPAMVDMLWELHADLGSRAPIHIVCGYRSSATNKFLKRIGRNVARHSQHTKGNAIDFYFPDVPTQKIRDSALVRQMGGVGYYRTAGGPTGFLHIDSGNVRHWPRISASKMASIMRNARKTVGRRLTNTAPAMDVAQADTAETKTKSRTLLSFFGGRKKQAAPEQPVASINPSVLYGDDELSELAGMAADASAASNRQNTEQSGGAMAALAASASEQPDEVEGEIRVGTPIPRPRLKPIEIMMMAAAKMNIEPASAPPPRALRAAKPDKNTSIALFDEQSDALKTVTAKPKTKAAERSDLGVELSGLFEAKKLTLPQIRPVIAAAMLEDVNWWPQLDSEKTVQASESTQTIMRDGKSGIDPALLDFATN